MEQRRIKKQPSYRRDDDHGVYDDPGHLRTNPTPISDEARKKSAAAGGVLGNIDDVLAQSDAANAKARESLAKAEETGATPDASRAEKKEAKDVDSDKSDDQLGKGFTENDQKKKKRFRLTGRQKATAGILTVFIGGAGIVGIMQAPSFAINHLRELLLDHKLQSRHSLRYRRRYVHRIGDLFSRDGRRGGKIIAEMERRGYRFAFDRSGKMIGITTPGGTGIPSYAIADHLSDYMELYHPFRTSRWKTKRMEAFYSRYRVTRRPVVIRVDDDPEDPERAVNKKVAEDVFGDDVDSSVRARSGGEDETDEQRAAREEQDRLAAEGDGSLDDLKQKLRDGVPLEELTDEERKLLAVTIRVDQEVADLMDQISKSGSLGSRVFNSIKSFGTWTEIADKLCIGKKRVGGIEFAARTYRAAGMLRYAGTFVKLADKLRSPNLTPGDIDPKMVNVLMGRVTALDSNGNSFGGAPSIAYLLKGRFSKSKNDAFRGAYAVDGKLTGITAGFKGALDQVPGVNDTSCRIVQNPITQIGSIVVDLVVGFFSGGSSKAVSESSKQAFRQYLSQVLRSLLTKRTAKSLAAGVAIDIGFEAGLTLLQIYAERTTAIPFTGQEKGADLGQAIGGGSGTLRKQRGLQSGMVPATASQYEVAQRELIAEDREIAKTQSIFTRYFDYDNHDSAAFRMMSEFSSAQLSGNLKFANMARSVISSPLKLFSSFSNVLLGKAGAQNSDEVNYDIYKIGDDDLAVDPVGNLIPIYRSDIENIDPNENIEFLTESGDINAEKLENGEWDLETLEPVSDDFKDHVANCVESVDTISILESGNQSDPKNDCLAKLAITVRYKAHLAFLDMVDGVDASVFSEEIDGSSSADSAGAPQPAEIGASL